MVPPREWSPDSGILEAVTRKTVLVCGATGFIGRNLAESLAADTRYRVRGVTFKRPPFAHPAIEFVEADLTDRRDVERIMAGTDIVIQAAATTSGAADIVARPHIHVTDNAVMNSLILRAAFERKVEHLVFFSCTVMYPSSPRPQAEDDLDLNAPIDPRYFGAAWTKLYVERMCEFYAGRGDTRFTVLRHSNVYGPHDKYDLERSHVFGASIAKVMTSSDGKVVVWGNGEEARDLIHVSDLVAAVRLALERQRQPFGLYNIGAGEAVTIRDLVARIIALSGRDLMLEFDTSRPSIPVSITVDTARARRDLGWQPHTSLDDGIARTLAWYRDTIQRESGA